MAEITEVPPPGKRKSPTRELIETIVFALLIAVAVRTFVVEVYRVDGSSMEATLHSGERVLVNKFLYSWFRSPKPGEIVVFQYPKQPDRDFIKRVVAVAGDTVEINAGHLYVNGTPFTEAPKVLLSADSQGPQVVPPDSVWVMGDNRNNSEDSRIFGQVPLRNIRGMAFMRIWPLTRLCHFVTPIDQSGQGSKGDLSCP